MNSLLETTAMKFSIIFLLTALSLISHAAEKIPLADFLNGIRHQLHSIENSGGNQSMPAMIKNVHIDMHVIAEKDKDGNTAYYVLEGMVDNKGLVTQKLSLDLDLQHNASRIGNNKGYRSYSTRKRDYTYGPDMYRQPGQYPYHPNQYMPDIYPVITLDKAR